MHKMISPLEALNNRPRSQWENSRIQKSYENTLHDNASFLECEQTQWNIIMFESVNNER
ncbi:hypothetical protein Hanom_Chr01g00074591 [Helianthus anomalus]